jgi:hypothetical protein
MAKRRRANRPVGPLATEPEKRPASCKLRRIPDSIDFGAETGKIIKLFTHDHVGVALIAKAEYGGKQLVPPGQATSHIEFGALLGRNTLKMVFVFSASVMGRGELREQCSETESQFLRALAGDEPLQLLRIMGS